MPLSSEDCSGSGEILTMEGQIVGSEIHGFRTLQDLDVRSTMAEARSRWLRPNEIHAILSNCKYFVINVKPVNLPKSGTIVLFDRKMLRNFRKDGHNWKKKKDGKTVKEAHEHLKVGDEERIHVYYAHGQDNPTFVRRCYWLLDKSMQHIVLVHYRETQEGSPLTSVNSNSGSVSDPSSPLLLLEELDSGNNHGYNVEQKQLLDHGDSLTVQNHEQRLHDINTLEWDELLGINDPNNSAASGGDTVSIYQQEVAGNDSFSCGTGNLSADISCFSNFADPTVGSHNIDFNLQDSGYVQKIGDQLNSVVLKKNSIGMETVDSCNVLVSDSLHKQDSLRRWMENIITEPPGIVTDCNLESSISSYPNSSASPAINDLHTSFPEQIFSITDISPTWAYSNEKTKILVTGFFHQQFLHYGKSNLICVCGDICTTGEIIQVGVYRCLLSVHAPGLVNLFMSFDGHKPISQVLSFEYRIPVSSEPDVYSEEQRREEFQLQLRLSHLLFTTSKSLDILSSKVSPNNLKEAKKFALKTSHISNSWSSFIKSIEDNKIAFSQAKDSVMIHILRNRLKEWLLERIVNGSKTTELDAQGQGAFHLCAILGYTWAVCLFSWSGLSLDFRDKHGWTALHWAAYCGREKMVGALLSAGAKPNLVTDPTSDNPGGLIAADLATIKGYHGLAAYLSEKALIEQFEAMRVAGNVSGTLQPCTNDTANPENLSEDQLFGDSLAALRTAADAAARIQVAIREHALKQRTKAVESSMPEIEARNIIAAMKIQHAYQNYERRKKMKAAARIQYRFRTWKIRKDFLNMRHQAIKIQAAFRSFQMRKQYRKVLWSVGVLEKAILRWRLKRKGLRGLQVDPVEIVVNQTQESDTEEDFYKTSRKQAEERVERAVVSVQAIFRSKKAQEEYRRIKQTHKQAELEYESMFDPDTDMFD